jgi:hypothetical protein
LSEQSPATRSDQGFPERAASIRRAAAGLCALLGWAHLHEVTLPNGRRADLMALRPDGGFVCIEIKSGARDFLVDAKWPEYRACADALYFAVDTDFPQALLPETVGLIVTHGRTAELIREAPAHPIPTRLRHRLLFRFAALAATRLAVLEDPEGAAALRAALRVE